MLPLLEIVSVGVTPEGSEPLFGPKNHSKVGEDTLGSGIGVIVAEQSRIEFSPVTLEPDLKIVTAPILTAVDFYL
jgi:hypothetical protein